MTRYSARALAPITGAERRPGYSALPSRRPYRLRDCIALVLLTALGILTIVLGCDPVRSAGAAAALIGSGIACVVFGTAGLLITYLRAARLRPPAPSLTTLDGVPATVLHREAVAFRLGVTLTVVPAIVCWALAVAAVLAEIGIFAVLLVPAGLWFAYPCVLLARGRLNAGALWLSPHGFVYRSRGLLFEVRWDDLAVVEGATYGGIVVVGARRGVTIEHTLIAGMWGTEMQRAPDTAVLRTDDTCLDPGSLARVLGRYMLRPELREELGTPTSLVIIESLRRPPPPGVSTPPWSAVPPPSTASGPGASS